MPITFHQVPDWDSWENQGGNITSADLDGDGVPELIVLRVDHPDNGPNRGFYRVGKNLDVNGTVNSGWNPWIEIPNWGSNMNEGAGIAIADFGADGLGLVVFQIQHLTPGPNKGLFCIGRKLNADGKVTGGWTKWQEIPGWFSWRNQGAAVCVDDLDGDGQPELIVFQIDDFHSDNPKHPNKGFYRIGNKLTADGKVSRWSDWIEVDWFSWFNQGAGIAVTDLDSNGRHEIIIFQVDNPPGENGGFYRVGWNLDPQGIVQDGWSSWIRIEDWQSFEDQGGGFTLASFPHSKPKAVIFHVDNPQQLNTGLFAVTDLTLDIDTADTLGAWRLMPYFSEVLPVHAALLNTGKVLFFAGSGNNAFRFSSPDFGNEAKHHYTSVVWDPSKNVLDSATFTHPPTLHRANGSVIDFFCCGHTFLADGRLMVAGGTEEYDKIIKSGQMVDAGHGFKGTREALIFDPLKEQWHEIKPMTRGRWYPTLLRLHDGSVIAASGLDENANGPENNTIERNDDPDNAIWRKQRNFDLPLYPHLFELKDGRLFYTGGKMDTDGPSDPLVFDPLHPTASMLIDGLTDENQCNQSASVILPPAQEQKFMILGGGPDDEKSELRGRATQRVAVVDFNTAKPTYQAMAKLNHERMHVNAVILPDRTVMAVGGAVTREASVRTKVVDPDGGREVFQAEIFDPIRNTWSVTAAATIARLYHSVALLLPDGRVVAAGGNPDKGSQVDWLPPDIREEMRLEIFSPPYLFSQNPRPVILKASTMLSYGSSISIETNKPNDVKWISLIMPGLTTHSFNCTQRLVNVPFTVNLPDKLIANIPNEKTLAPPGWYMLFLCDKDGIPSVASWVKLS